MASSVNLKAPSSDETSYLDMSKAENSSGDAFLVGKHCQLEYCNQLDFLPFKCQSCTKIFCLEHRTEDAHKCTSAGAWAERKRLAAASAPSIGQGRAVRDRFYIPPGSICAARDCQSEIGASLHTGVRCDQCRQAYCLKHRLREQHECVTRVEEARKARDKLGVEDALVTFKTRWTAWRANQKEKTKKLSFLKPTPSAASQRLKLMNEIKQKAKGDQKLPADKRVYLVVAAAEKNPKGIYPKEMFFYSKDWVVGRMLDAAAKAMQVENVNNQTSEGKSRLQVFHVEGEKFLSFSDKLGTTLQNGHRVVITRGGIPPDEVISMLLS